MPGLVPGIHVLGYPEQGVDGRDKPGHDTVDTAGPMAPTDVIAAAGGEYASRPFHPATNVNSAIARERSIFTGKGRIALGGPLDESD
ncbi:hypothetical protein IQ17_02588 [Bradyrhizobium daqingense]|uniref:Uncharacterized protein n=1 Tax=Bradyrhizobium daqingense TaxID=993502 RepID=A0A562LHU9_9BRAD|nr:hypothetical protein IQ17_02588 [Bradyrhizobium daqingense]